MKTMREGWWAVEDEPKLKLKTASLKKKGKEKRENGESIAYEVIEYFIF